ncbi:hypothetical protein ACQ1RF_11515, partial [Ornithobacterium rhinotracheale]
TAEPIMQNSLIFFVNQQLNGKYDPDDENGQKEIEESFSKRVAAQDIVLRNKRSVETLQTSQ